MADKNLVKYVEETLKKGYSIDSIKEAIIKSGYTMQACEDAMSYVVNFKNMILFVYTLISLTLGFFSLSYLGLKLSESVKIQIIFLSSLTVMWAFFSSISLKSIITGKHSFFGYFIPVGAIIDILINTRTHWSLSFTVVVIFSLFYYLKSKVL